MAKASTGRGTLAQTLERDGPLGPAEAARLGARLAHIVGELHSRGSVHGALSADAIYYTSPDEVELAAGSAESAQRYLAPERLSNTLSHATASDVWSLGVVLYESVCGHTPYPHTGKRLLESLTNNGVPKLQRLAPWIDAQLATLVHEALVVAPPEQRPSAQTLADELAACAARLDPRAGRVIPNAVGNSDATPPAEEAPNGAAGDDDNDGRSYDIEKGKDVSASERESAETVRSGPERPEVEPFALAVGDSVAGYPLLRLLGSGGMGSVFETRDPQGTPLALKVMRPDGLSAEAIRRFAREARSAMRIDSEHVTRVLEVNTTHTPPFMVMELLSGRDLSSTLTRTGALPPAVAARIIADACIGLAAAHDLGLVHRDIKPSNIFLHENEDDTITVKLCDFGVVKQELPATDESSALTQTGGLVGTPAYMSPEQVQSPKSVDGRTDLWSMALSLHAALSGQKPWAECKDFGEILVALYTKDVPHIQAVAPWVGPELALAVHAGLQRDRSKRIGSARELAERLEPLAADAPLTKSALRPLAPQERESEAERAPASAVDDAAVGSKPSRRATAVLAVGAIALVGVASTLAWRDRGAPSPVASAAPAKCEDAAGCSKSLGEPARCREDGTCVALGSAQCRVEVEPGATRRDDTVWIGTMFPQGSNDPTQKTLGESAQRAAALAVREVSKVAGGVPSGSTTRPIGLIACDDAADPDAAARHLVEDVRVAAVIGFGENAGARDLLRTRFVNNDVLILAAINGSSLSEKARQPPDAPRLVWRSFANASRVRALGKLVAKFAEPRLRREQPSLRSKPLNVSLCLPQDESGKRLAADLLAVLRFNDKPAVDNGEHFQKVALTASGTEGTRAAQAIAKLVDRRPHVVILHDADDATLGRVIAPLEERWASNTKHRPLYVVGAALDASGALPDLMQRHPTLGGRVIGLAPKATPATAAFTRRYDAAARDRQTSSDAAGSAYDSAYVVAYALAALPPGPATGRALSRAIERLLSPGEPVEVGPIDLTKGFVALQQGKRIDLIGARSQLDFDLNSGEPLDDIAVACARSSSTGVRFVESGLVYDRKADALTGTFDCRPEVTAAASADEAASHPSEAAANQGSVAPKQGQDLEQPSAVDLPKPVLLVLKEYVSLLRDSPDLEECAKRFLRIAGGVLVTEAGTELVTTVKRFSLRRDFDNIKTYAYPPRITRVTKSTSKASGFGPSMIRGEVYQIWLAKKAGAGGLPAPISILWPREHASIKQPKIIAIGAL
ncbi:MAG: serine/threonine-protein kinase [Polyangiaceae bacterium]